MLNLTWSQVDFEAGTVRLEPQTRWTSACKQAGVVGMLVHDFRRTGVRNVERAGVPRSVAMRLTEHKTESVYRRYAIVSESDLREGVQKLANLHRSDRDQARQIVEPLRAS